MLKAQLKGRKIVKLAIIALLLVSFSCQDNSCPRNYFQNITSFKIEPDCSTAGGFRVDTSGYPIDLGVLGLRLQKIENCLKETYDDHPTLSQEEMEQGKCLLQDLRIAEKIRRDCLIVKIVEPVFSDCSNFQFIKECEACGPAYANQQYCIDKGVVPSQDCPCVWRTAIQNDWAVITPPVLYLWDVIRAVTGCNNIWKTPYSKCAVF